MTAPLILVESSQSHPRRIPLAGDIRKKRALPVEPLGGTPTDERRPSSKKPCLQSTLRPTWNPSTFPTESSPDTSPTSQLFVSLPTWRRPPLPPRFWSSGAGAAMPTRTITLAQGTIDTGSSPPIIIPKRATPETGDGSSGMQILSQIGIIEMLEQDERPTFIIDLGDPAILIPGPLHVLFANAALRSCQGFLDLITGKADQVSPLLSITTTFPEFKAWSTSIVKDHEPTGVPLSPFLYAGITWTYSTLRRRLRFVSGTSVPAFAKSKSVLEGRLAPTPVPNGLWESPTSVKVDISELEEAPDYFGAAPVQVCAETVIEGTRSGTASGIESPETSACNQDSASYTIPNGQVVRSSRSNHNGRLSDFSPLSMNPNEAVPAMDGSVRDVSHSSESLDQGYFDWTRLPLSPTLPRHIQFFRNVDWASTSLGPIEHWSPMLRAMSNLIMSSPHPAAMYWGDDHIAIYNEAYVHLAGQKHPALMGSSYQEAWSEIWEAVKDVFVNAKSTGQPTMKDDDRLFMKRSGFLEETYFSWSIVPLVGENGNVVGLYNPAFELTRRKIADRRMHTLREVGERTAAAKEIKDFWGQVLEGLQYNEYDAPFVLLYSVSEDLNSDESSTQFKQCLLEGALGRSQGSSGCAATDRSQVRLGRLWPSFQRSHEHRSPCSSGDRERLVVTCSD